MKKILTLLILFAPLAMQAQTLAVGRVEAPQEVSFAQPFTATVELSHPQGQTPTLVPDSISPDFALTKADWQSLSPTLTQAQLTLMPFALKKSTFTASFALTANPAVTSPVEIPLTVNPVKLFKDNDFILYDA